MGKKFAPQKKEQNHQKGETGPIFLYVRVLATEIVRSENKEQHDRYPQSTRLHSRVMTNLMVFVFSSIATIVPIAVA